MSTYQFECKCRCVVQPTLGRWLLETLFESDQEDGFQVRKHSAPMRILKNVRKYFSFTLLMFHYKIHASLKGCFTYKGTAGNL